MSDTAGIQLTGRCDANFPCCPNHDCACPVHVGLGAAIDGWISCHCGVEYEFRQHCDRPAMAVVTFKLRGGLAVHEACWTHARAVSAMKDGRVIPLS